MAGIGFAINKIVKEKKISSKPRAFAYASIVAVAPLLLGELVLIAVYSLAALSQLLLTERNLIVAVITYGLLGSLLVNGFFSLIVSRYLSDQIYQKKLDNMLPTYWGSQLLLLVVGGALYGLFIVFSGVGILTAVLAWVLFCELLLSWNAMNFLTILKDYVGIAKAFLLTIFTSFGMGGLFLLLGVTPIPALLSGIVLGYASFFIQVTILLYRHFPNRRLRKGHLFDFLAYFDEFYRLSVIGGCTQVGLLGHIVVVWFSPIGQQVKGLFYIAPYYDLTVFLASLTMLVTTVYFIIYLEVDFFEAYRKYHLAISHGATLWQLKKAEADLLTCLRDGLRKIVWIQLVVTLLAVSVGTILLSNLPLGFNNTMSGYFRILCVAYAIYGMANVVALSTMYFGNTEGNYRASIYFAATSILATILMLFANSLLYGFGFFVGSTVYFALSWIDLEKISNQLLYQILGKQPIFIKARAGFFTHLAERLNRKALAVTKRSRL